MRIAGRSIDGTDGETSSTVAYRRLGFVPRDPELAHRAPGGFATKLIVGFISLVNMMRPNEQLAEPAAIAPFGIQEYEIEQSFGSLVASVRRFMAVGEAPTAMALPASRFDQGPPPEAAPDVPLTDSALSAIDARLAEPSPAPTVADET